MRSVLRMSVLFGLLALGGAPAASAAGAAPSARRVGVPAGLVAPGLLRAPRSARAHAAPAIKSVNYLLAGYATFKTGSSSALTTFRVPKVTCSSVDSGIAPGAFVTAGPTTNEVYDAAALLLNCVGGALVINEDLIVGGTQNFSSNPVAAGDTIQASSSVGAGGATVTIKDLASARAFTLTATGGDTAADYELVGVDSVVSRSTGQQLPVPSFAPVRFTSTTVGGAPLGGIAQLRLVMTNGCAVEIIPSGFDGTGTAFTTLIPTVDITAVSPTTGPTGTLVTIAGAGFNSTSAVSFAGAPATALTHVSASELQAKVPLTASSGPITVKNTAAPLGAVSSGCPYTVTPVIASFTPGSGVTGSSVTINGSGFKGASQVKFGMLAAKFTASSATQIKATVPNGTVAGKISVTTAGGTATSAATFTPTLSLTSFGPACGPSGTVVTITGIGFNGTSGVGFNGTAATTVTHVSSTQLKATVPSAATSGPVSVTNAAAPSGTAQSARTYTLTPHTAPAVSSFTPASGITGSTVTITGTNLCGTSGVKFATRAAAFKFVSTTELTATVPNGAIAGKISVSTAAGTGTSASTYTPTLSITSFSPASGAAGAVVTINGVGFTAGSTVKFNGTAAGGVTFVSATQLKATVPTGVTAGPISVTNTTAPIGSVLSYANFT